LRRARSRAGQERSQARQEAAAGITALYVRRLVARDLGGAPPAANPAAVYDLGASDGSDVAANKDAMLAGAFTSGGRKPRRRSA
jgi:hypothetical protein